MYVSHQLRRKKKQTNSDDLILKEKLHEKRAGEVHHTETVFGYLY